MPDRGSEKISPRREIAAATGDLIKLQREELHPGAAACCVPAIVIILVCGRIFDQPYAALVATAGAFSVGFGLFQRLSSFAIVPMLLALLGMMVSATVGTLASATPLSEGITAAIWAFGVAAAAGLGTAVWWIVLQWSIALVIAAAFPADPAFALLRGMLVALGGTLQLVIATSLWARFAGDAMFRLPGTRTPSRSPLSRCGWRFAKPWNRAPRGFAML